MLTHVIVWLGEIVVGCVTLLQVCTARQKLAEMWRIDEVKSLGSKVGEGGQRCAIKIGPVQFLVWLKDGRPTIPTIGGWTMPHLGQETDGTVSNCAQSSHAWSLVHWPAASAHIPSPNC